MRNLQTWGSLDPFFEPGDVLGRRVANSEFLRALLTLDPFPNYHFFLSTEHLQLEVSENIKLAAPEIWDQGRVTVASRMALCRVLEQNEYHCFHLSDCITSPAWLAALRNSRARNIFPITGTTHSLAYFDYGQAFLKHLWPGVTPRDAIVATSRAAVFAVREMFAFLRENYGLSPEIFPQPRVERIPLGVCPEKFKPPGPEVRDAARARLGIPPQRTAFLCLARLDYFSKMDLLPLFWAFRRAFGDGLSRESVCLVLAGWCEENFEFGNILKGLAQSLGLELILLQRPSEEEKLAVYGACDVFLSLADNYQETFGLTLLEAACMGLPVVASDFDGYRDLVRPGRTGELIRLCGPSQSRREDLMAPLIYDYHALFSLAQQCAADVPQLAQVMLKLVKNPELRMAYGRSGREMALESYTWKAAVEAHLELWERLNSQSVETPEAPRQMSHPLALNYARIFGPYASDFLDESKNVRASKSGEAFYRGRYTPPSYAVLDEHLKLEVVKKLMFFARKPVNAMRLCGLAEAELPGHMRDLSQAHVLWALKQDLLEFCDADA